MTASIAPGLRTLRHGPSAAVLVAGIVACILVAGAIVTGNLELAIALAGAMAFLVASLIEPRLAFAIPLFFVLLVIHEPGGLAPTDFVYLAGPAIVVVAAFAQSPISRRAWKLIARFPYWPIVAVFAAVIAIASIRGIVGFAGEGAITPLRFAVGPLLLLSFAVFKGPEDLLRTLRATFYTYIVYQVGVLIYATSTGEVFTRGAVEVSTGGSRLVRLTIAMNIAIAVFLAALHFASTRSSRVRAGLVLIMVAGLVMVILSLGRATWLGFVIAAAVLLFLTPQGRRAVATLGLVLAPTLALSAVLAPVLAPGQVAAVRDRLASPSTETDASSLWRERAWSQMLEVWRESPILGNGFGQYGSFLDPNGDVPVFFVNDPHNGFIMFLATTGLLGLVALVVLQLAFLRSVAVAIKGGGAVCQIGLWAVWAWILFMVNTYFGGNFSNLPLMVLFWYILLMPAAALALLPDSLYERVISARPTRRPVEPGPAGAGRGSDGPVLLPDRA